MKVTYHIHRVRRDDWQDNDKWFAETEHHWQISNLGKYLILGELGGVGGSCRLNIMISVSHRWRTMASSIGSTLVLMLAFGYTTTDNIWGMVSTCKLSILREHLGSCGSQQNETVDCAALWYPSHISLWRDLAFLPWWFILILFRQQKKQNILKCTFVLFYWFRLFNYFLKVLQYVISATQS